MGRALTILTRAWPLLLAPATMLGQQYKADQAGPPPPEVAPGVAQALAKTGFQISANGVRYCEIWLRTTVPSGLRPTEHTATLDANPANVTLPNIPVGALLGVIRFDGEGSDRRGQSMKPGVYTLRYGIMPLNADHQGAAPQRDFLLLIPASEDRDLNATPNFHRLVALSRKASLTAHPAVLSVRKAASDSPGFSRQGDTDWVLEAQVGDTPIAIIVAGTAGS
ncbi:MAG: hypothetical protein ACLPWF_28170 [Bryobacteraceae bacterium]